MRAGQCMDELIQMALLLISRRQEGSRRILLSYPCAVPVAVRCRAWSICMHPQHRWCLVMFGHSGRHVLLNTKCYVAFLSQRFAKPERMSPDVRQLGTARANVLHCLL